MQGLHQTMAERLALQKLEEAEGEAPDGVVCGGDCGQVRRQQLLPAQ